MELEENERIDDLQYRGLKLIQNTKEFCFGVDSVLLSDFAKHIKKEARVLDLGTGTGIIGILLCKKTKLKEIIGIEIQKKMCDMANRTILLNSLEDKFKIKNINIKNVDEHLGMEGFDVIVSNPPYKKKNTGLQNERQSIYIARHEVECDLEDIARVSYSLLKDKGEMYIVHRPERLVDIFSCFRNYHLEPKILRMVHSKQNEKPILVLVKAIKNGGQFLKIDKPLVLYQEDGTYTQEVRNIYEKGEKEK